MANKFKIKHSLLLIGMLLSCFSCEMFLPDNQDVFGDDTRFTQTVYKPMLGRNVLMNNNFNPGNSSRPFSMKIINMRRADGTPATELMENFPITVWKKPYTGLESSLEEIESKRGVEYHSLFSIREHSGDFMMWAGANSSFVKCEPDPGYIFDVEVSNTGGRRYFKDMQLIPQRERAYEPSIYDPTVGIAKDAFVRPLQVINVKGENSRFEITQDDIKIYFHKNEEITEDDKTLTFRFFDGEYKPIDPNKFNLTNWTKLVHGFDMEKTSEYVRYRAAYPIPLINYKTAYTNTAGNMAHTVFSYDRINAGGFREVSQIVFDFAIYEEGHWEIVMVFEKDSPRFRND